MESIVEYFKLFAAHWPEIGGALLSILGGFSVIAKITPNEVDNKIVNALFNFVHFFGLTKK